MKIGLATLEQRNWSGGIASHVEGLAKGLRDQGVQVESSWGVGVAALARFHPFQFYPTYFSAMRNLKGVDVVHAHDPRLARLGGSLRRPVVTTFHGYMPLEMRALHNGHSREFMVRAAERFMRRAVLESDAIITVDRRIAEWIHSEYLYDNLGDARGRGTPVHVIPNGVDTDMFHPPPDGGGSPRAARVLFAKAFTPKNGPDIARAAMEIVRHEIPDVDFLMTRSTPHRKMPDLIRSSDVVIVPSVPIGGVEEATSCLALEAMASGRVVIASDIGGLHQLIDSGETGILVPPGDPETLAEYVIQVLQDDFQREYIGKRAREYVVANHTWAQVARETMKVYGEVLGE